MINFTFALIAFAVGVGSERVFDKYLETTSPRVLDSFPNQPELNRLTSPLPLERWGTQLPPRSLPNKLQRIDEKYRRQCQLPTDWNGQWPTVKQLAEFRFCNDEWATARRKAINEELDNYRVQY